MCCYRGRFVAGETRAGMVASFSESPEDQDRTAGIVAGGIWDAIDNGAIVARLCDAMFGRLPGLAGLVEGLLGSPKFGARYGANPPTARFVDLRYRNTLDRTASAEEVA